jgi:hypothetical protein
MARPSYTICGGQADADRLARQAAVMAEATSAIPSRSGHRWEPPQRVAPSVYHRPVTGSEQFWRAGDIGASLARLAARRASCRSVGRRHP